VTDAKKKTDWRSRLRDVAQRSTKKEQRAVGVEDARRAVAEFLEGTVAPAFEELRGELEALGRDVEIDVTDHFAAITVFKDGAEEFSYAVRGRIYNRMSFAFPEVGRDDQPKVVRGRIEVHGGERHEYAVREFTTEGIIQDFLDEYAKWKGW
jgi:choline/glycine/proline betaine transport protein